MIDLSPEQLKTVRLLLSAHAPACEVCAFGSRVAGSAKPYSDLDLALKGPEKLTPMQMWRLREAFQESDLSMRVDILDWHAISEDFRKVILRRCEVIQEAASSESAK
jgi:predicted nucleotidyltransferase